MLESFYKSLRTTNMRREDIDREQSSEMGGGFDGCSKEDGFYSNEANSSTSSGYRQCDGDNKGVTMEFWFSSRLAKFFVLGLLNSNMHR